MQLKHFSKMYNQLESCLTGEQLLFSDVYLAANNLNFDAPISNIRSDCLQQGLMFNLLDHLFTFDPTVITMEIMVLDGCKLVFVDLLDNTLFAYADCSASGPGPIPSPTPGPGPGKWEGWATTSIDGGMGDWEDRFGGPHPGYKPNVNPDLPGAGINNNRFNHAGASIPWAFLCKKYGSKKKLIDEIEKQKGLCWEAQSLKQNKEAFNPTQWNKELSNNSYNGNGNKDINDDTYVDTTTTYTIQFAVGCGGFCNHKKPLSEDQCDATSSIGCGSMAGDCVNDCTWCNSMIDPCSIKDNRYLCKYLNYINNTIKYNYTNQNMVNMLETTNVCNIPYNLSTGNYTPPGDNTQHINYCTGVNMHFDLTNELSGHISTQEPEGQIFRYRPIKCPN